MTYKPNFIKCADFCSEYNIRQNTVYAFKHYKLNYASKLNQLDYKEKMNGEEIQEAGYANAAMAIINTKERLTLDS